MALAIASAFPQHWSRGQDRPHGCCHCAVLKIAPWPRSRSRCARTPCAGTGAVAAVLFLVLWPQPQQLSCSSGPRCSWNWAVWLVAALHAITGSGATVMLLLGQDLGTKNSTTVLAPEAAALQPQFQPWHPGHPPCCPAPGAVITWPWAHVPPFPKAGVGAWLDHVVAAGSEAGLKIAQQLQPQPQPQGQLHCSPGSRPGTWGSCLAHGPTPEGAGVGTGGTKNSSQVCMMTVGDLGPWYSI